MKKKIITALFASALASHAASAYDYYGRLGFSASNMNPFKIGTSSFSQSVLFAAGMEIFPNITAGLDGRLWMSDSKVAKFAQGDLLIRGTPMTIGVSSRYSFNISEQINVFAGLRFGYMNGYYGIKDLSAEAKKYSKERQESYKNMCDLKSLTYSVGFGSGFSINENISAELGYSLDMYSVKSSQTLSSEAGRSGSDNISSHSLMLGLNYKF